jgi:hypothetical protein
LVWHKDSPRTLLRLEADADEDEEGLRPQRASDRTSTQVRLGVEIKWTFLAVEMEFIPTAPRESVVPSFVLVPPVRILNLTI